MNTSIALPAVLFLSNNVRKQWVDVLLLYVESHAIGATVYLSVSLPIRRKRPFTFNPDEFLYRKQGKKSTDSFFSGHVSVSATSSFFMAKIFTDLHEIKGLERMAYYGLALIPPVTTGYFRFRAGRHFPSDLLTGLVVGAAVGILTPELHKNKNTKLTVTPVTGFGIIGLNAKLVLGK